nr:reverse transcriptase domain-containing protein [Tanacetum cinerariifolium]
LEATFWTECPVNALESLRASPWFDTHATNPLLLNGVSYDGPKIPPPPSSLPPVVEIEPETTKDTVNPTNNGRTEDVQPQAVHPKPVTSLISEPKITPVSMDECLALADLGASINLMPYFVWKRLSLSDLTPTYMTLELVDRLITSPVGIAEDVYVKVGSFHFPADFVVVDIDANPRVYLILGRSFLKTGKALIDVFEEEVDAFLAVEDEPTSSEFYQPYLNPEGDILLLEAFLNDDPSPPLYQGNYMAEVRKELKIYEAHSEKSPTSEKGEPQNPRCDLARGDQTPRSWINLPHL